MSQSHCPICYSSIEVRTVTPCLICGGLEDSVTRFDEASRFTEFRLPDDRLIVLCPACELEEFMVRNGWGYQLIPNETLPINGLQRIRTLENPKLGHDKFCPTCNLRLAFIKLIATPSNEG